jgi:hypothetical protein
VVGVRCVMDVCVALHLRVWLEGGLGLWHPTHEKMLITASEL